MAVDSWYWHVHAQSGRFDIDKPLRDYADAEWRELVVGSGGKVAVSGGGKKINLE